MFRAVPGVGCTGAGTCSVFAWGKYLALSELMVREAFLEAVAGLAILCGSWLVAAMHGDPTAPTEDKSGLGNSPGGWPWPSGASSIRGCRLSAVGDIFLGFALGVDCTDMGLSSSFLA